MLTFFLLIFLQLLLIRSFYWELIVLVSGTVSLMAIPINATSHYDTIITLIMMLTSMLLTDFLVVFSHIACLIITGHDVIVTDSYFQLRISRLDYCLRSCSRCEGHMLVAIYEPANYISNPLPPPSNRETLALPLANILIL